MLVHPHMHRCAAGLRPSAGWITYVPSCAGKYWLLRSAALARPLQPAAAHAELAALCDAYGYTSAVLKKLPTKSLESYGRKWSGTGGGVGGGGWGIAPGAKGGGLMWRSGQSRQ